MITKKNTVFEVYQYTVFSGITISANADYHNRTYGFSIPAGYTALGVIGYSITGTGSTFIVVSQMYTSGNTLYYSLRNSRNSDSYGLIFCIRILCYKNE